MDSESLKEAVNRLVGDITAEAETLHDEQALENIKTAEEAIAYLISKLCSNARLRNERADSVSEMGHMSYTILFDIVCRNFDIFELIVEEIHEEEE